MGGKKLLYILAFVALGPLLILANCSQGPGANSDRPRPNIVLITIDTLRQDALSCYGAERQTPVIDAFAAKSVQFMDASCALSVTLPSHVSLMTGLYPRNHGIYRGSQLPKKDLLTLAEILSEEGYDTAAVVSSLPLAKRWAVSEGFARYDEPESPQVENPEETTEAFREMLSTMKPPYFLWVHYFGPHQPYKPKQKFYSAHLEVDTSDEIMTPELKEFEENNVYQWPFPKLSKEDVAALRDLYDDEVREVDSEFEAVFDMLDFDNSIIILTADHGEAFGEHNNLTHGKGLWPENYQVPLLYYSPGRTPFKAPYQVSLVDVVPTILDELSLATPAIDGVSLFDTEPHTVIIEQRDYRNCFIGERYPPSLLIKRDEIPPSPDEALSTQDRDALKALGYLR